MRSARFFNDAQLVNLYKSQLLGYIEYRSAAIYHACDTLLAPLDEIQMQIVRAAGMNPLEALMVASLAPLAARRDMAMLGAIHWAVLRKGPMQLQAFFRPSHAQVPGREMSASGTSRGQRVSSELKCTAARLPWAYRSLGSMSNPRTRGLHTCLLCTGCLRKLYLRRFYIHPSMCTGL